MECSSMFFPIQVKQELPDNGYETSNNNNNPSSGFYSHSFLPPHAIKSEAGLINLQPLAPHHCLPSSSPPTPPSTVDGSAIIHGGVGIGSVGMYHHHHHHQQHNNSSSSSSSALTKTKKKKKKIKQEMVVEQPRMGGSMMGMMETQSSGVGGGGGVGRGKKTKQEKITDTFKVRKKVDRFNGMPEEEVVKRTLPDHLTTDLDIVIIGINPGLYAAFKGHHYAGPGNHFWKCLFLSGLIPDPMTADDDFRLIEYGIGFTNIVARTTRGSADLSRKEIREGAQILQEKLQKFKPKIAVFNGKGIFEVYSGRKNFDFGKQPEPIEGTNTLIYVMPSSSARCAQLPRAVDKVPFYVALKKLRDHLCGRLPVLRDSEVCFPDVKLKTEDDCPRVDGDDDGHGGGASNSGDMNPPQPPQSNGPQDEESYQRQSLLHSQRNFHQHPLGRAALAAAAACGGYLEETLARANIVASTNKYQSTKHHLSASSSDGMLMEQPPKKKSKNKKKNKKSNEMDGGGGDVQTHHILQNMKCEPMSDGGVDSHPHNGIPMNGNDSNSSRNSPSNAHRSSSDYSSSSSSGRQMQQQQPTIQRPSPHPPSTHPLSNYGSPPSYGGQMSPSPGSEHHSPYGSPLGQYHHHPHIKQEKVDLMDGGRLTSPTPGSPSLLGGYPSSVGCLYNGPNSAGSPYGPPPPQPPPYFGGPAPPNPYGGFHPSLGPPHLSSHHLSSLNHHHNPLQNADLFSLSSTATSSVRENGLHGQQRQSLHAHQGVSMSQHESQYYGHSVTSSAGSPYSPLGSPTIPSPHKESPTTAAFHHYQPSATYHHLHQLQPAAPSHQYCPDGSPGGVYDHQTAPLYANLETVKIKQERLDPTYNDY